MRQLLPNAAKGASVPKRCKLGHQDAHGRSASKANWPLACEVATIWGCGVVISGGFILVSQKCVAFLGGREWYLPISSLSPGT